MYAVEQGLDRRERLALCSFAVGRPLATMRELARDEVAACAEALRRYAAWELELLPDGNELVVRCRPSDTAVPGGRRAG
jgi:hypothetical protein